MHQKSHTTHTINSEYCSPQPRAKPPFKMPTESIETKKEVALAAINRAKQALGAIPEGMDGREKIVAKIRVAEASLAELCKEEETRNEEMVQMAAEITATRGVTLKDNTTLGMTTALDKSVPTASSVEPPTITSTPSIRGPCSGLAAKRKEWLAKKAREALKDDESSVGENYARPIRQQQQSRISIVVGAAASQEVSEEKKTDDVSVITEECAEIPVSNSKIITSVLSIEEQEQIEVTYSLIEERLSWLETEQETVTATDAPEAAKKQSIEERMAWLEDMKRKAREASTLEEQTEIANMLIAAGTNWL